MSILHLQLNNQSVHIDNGELVSYLVDEYQVIHQKGAPGWRNADTEMFPIIGPTAAAGFIVHTPRGEAVQDQHGLLREVKYELSMHSSTKAVFEKVYLAGTAVRNSKYPMKSTAEFLQWPYDFRFRKTFELDANGLAVRFSVSGEKGMPFMLGYHPAFQLKTPTPTIETSAGRTVTLSEVLSVGSRALFVKEGGSITLHDKRSVKLKSSGFNHFMCWTEVPNMVCIEPITFYPYAVKQEELHQGFDQLVSDARHFALKFELCD